MTRAALCLSGHVRTYKQCLDNWKENVFSKVDTDVFISTWDKETAISPYSPNLEYTLDPEEIISDYKKAGAKRVFFSMEHYTEDVNELPKALGETITNAKWYNKEPYTTTKGLICYWYKIHDCIQAKKAYEKSEGFVYDIVMRARFDTAFDPELDHLAVTDYLNMYLAGPGHHDDLFWFGPSELMDRLAELFTDYEEVFDLHNDIIRHAHHIKELYLKYKGIPYVDRMSVNRIVR